MLMELNFRQVEEAEVCDELDVAVLLDLMLDQIVSRNHYPTMVPPFQHLEEPMLTNQG